MRTQRSRRIATLGIAVSALALTLVAPAGALAQSAPPKARDGRSLPDEPSAVQTAFAAAFGDTAGLQWQRLHNLAVRSDLQQAADGLTIQSAPPTVQTAFVAIYGGSAPANWAIMHSGQIGKAIILNGDLEEAVDGARAGNLNVARSEFKQFADAWENGFEPLVRPRSNTIADTVAAQIRTVATVLVTPQTPDRARYTAELEELADIVKQQQAKLAAMPAGAPVSVVIPVASAASTAGAAGTGPHLATVIDTGELVSSITGANQNDLVRARGELGEFFEAWDSVKADVQKENPQAYTEIAADLDAARKALPASGPAVAVSDFLPLELKALATIRKWQGLATETPAAAPAVTILRTKIDVGELEQSITATIGNNLNRARGDFGEFLDGWTEVRDAVRAENATAFSEIDADISAIPPVLNADGAGVAQVLPLLQKAQATIKKYQPAGN